VGRSGRRSWRPRVTAILRDGNGTPGVCQLSRSPTNQTQDTSHLATLKAELGDLSRVRRVVSVTGFVACAPTLTDHAAVANGAREVFAEVFGEAGRHAGAAVGVTGLPLDVPIEVEAVVEAA
jgi:enamine deaminase RidA (YjgF/YER057c/UK114 family)